MWTVHSALLLGDHPPQHEGLPTYQLCGRRRDEEREGEGMEGGR